MAFLRTALALLALLPLCAATANAQSDLTLPGVEAPPPPAPAPAPSGGSGGEVATHPEFATLGLQEITAQSTLSSVVARYGAGEQLSEDSEIKYSSAVLARSVETAIGAIAGRAADADLTLAFLYFPRFSEDKTFDSLFVHVGWFVDGGIRLADWDQVARKIGAAFGCPPESNLKAEPQLPHTHVTSCSKRNGQLYFSYEIRLNDMSYLGIRSIAESIVYMRIE